MRFTEGIAYQCSRKGKWRKCGQILFRFEGHHFRHVIVKSMDAELSEQLLKIAATPDSINLRIDNGKGSTIDGSWFVLLEDWETQDNRSTIPVFSIKATPATDKRWKNGPRVYKTRNGAKK